MQYFNVCVCTYLGRHVCMFVCVYIDAQAHTQCELRNGNGNQSSNLEKFNYL